MLQILPLPEASGPTDSKALESSAPKRSQGSSALQPACSLDNFCSFHSVLAGFPPVRGNSLLGSSELVVQLEGQGVPLQQTLAGFCFCWSHVSVLCWGQISKTWQLSKHFPLRRIPDTDLQLS